MLILARCRAALRCAVYNHSVLVAMVACVCRED